MKNMYVLQLLAVLGLRYRCAAQYTSLFKYKMGKMSNSSSIIDTFSSMYSVMDCERRCKARGDCMAANQCGTDCYLSNVTTQNVFDGLKNNASCLYAELVATCWNGIMSTQCSWKVTCPQDYNQIGALCVKYIKTKMSYEDANTICRDRGGHLLTLRSQQQIEILHNNCKRSSCKHIWIDGSGSRTWNDQPLPFENWDGGHKLQPGECPMLCTDKHTMKTADCTEKNEVYCQIDIK